MNITIDKEFKSLIPALTEDERQGLEASLKAEGCRDALVLWGNILIDGHNRYEICTQYGIPYKTVQKDFDSREDVIQWIILNQFGRRNLPMYERARLALRLKPVISAKAKENQGHRTDISQKSVKSTDTQKELAKVAGVSHDTISKVEKIEAKATPEIKTQLRTGEISINQAYQTIKQPHVAMNSGNNEWYTPTEIIETARRVMGSIDLDPASSEIANQTVKAETYYTAETNGLNKKWDGNVWLNPPYSTELIDKFVDKLVEQKDNYKQAIVLVNNATETEWFEKIVNVASAVCFPRHRVKFYKPDGKVGAPLQGQAILYIGGASNKFTSAFSQLGWCADVLR